MALTRPHQAGLSRGKRNAKFSVAGTGRDQFQRPPVRFGDPTRYRQPEPRAARPWRVGVGTSGIQSDEALEDPLAIRLGHAEARIDDADRVLPAAPSHLDADDSAGG